MPENNKKQTFTTKLYECCGKDELRPMLQCVHFKNGYAYASNAHVCIKQSLEYHTIIAPEELDGKALHRDSYKEVMKFDYATATDEGIDCNSANGASAFYNYYNPEVVDTGEDNLNNVGRNRVPDFEAILHPAKGQTSMSFIGINPDFLTVLMKALHAPSKAVRLQFTGIDSVIIVDVPEIENQTAIIMPVILEPTLQFNKK